MLILLFSLSYKFVTKLNTFFAYKFDAEVGSLLSTLVSPIIITPFLYRKYELVKNLANQFAVPIVQWYQTIYFLAGTVLLAFIPSNRKWEIYELAFSVIFLLIFLNPLNKSIYQK